MTNSQEAERLVCTLCSCYPWQLLGLPPSWYKDPAYRARVVKEPRAVLSEMGLDLADDAQWSYYEHWLGALEDVLIVHRVVLADDVTARAEVLAQRPVGHDHTHGR
jgi:hypothetical protein